MARAFFDPDTLAQLTGGDDPQLDSALREQLSRDLTRCAEALGAGPDPAGARAAAHELKGIALTIGAHTLAADCARAEALCDARDTAALRTALPDIAALAARTARALAVPAPDA